jgi:hypothetical protein
MSHSNQTAPAQGASNERKKRLQREQQHRGGKMTEKQVTEEDWPTEERIEAIGQNGGDGIHHQVLAYQKVIESGVYEA